MGTWNPDAKRDGCLAGHRQAASKADTAHPSSLSLWAQVGPWSKPTKWLIHAPFGREVLIYQLKKKNKEKSRACVLVCFLYSSHSICTLKKFMRNPHTCSIFSVLTLDLHKIWWRKHEPFKKKGTMKKMFLPLSYCMLKYLLIYHGRAFYVSDCLEYQVFHRDPPASACWTLGLKAHASTPGSLCLLISWSLKSFSIISGQPGQAFVINCMSSNGNIPNFISSQGKEVKNVVCRWGK